MRPGILTAVVAAALLCVAPSVAAQVPLGTPIPDRPLGAAVNEGPGGMDVFLQNQLVHERVAMAREITDYQLRSLFAEKGLEYPAPEIFLRVFKHERELEVWARSDRDDAFTLLRVYPVCALAGQLGPKRKMGDIQVPEGFYFIDDFNPRSEFHLSLRVNYPNMADRMRRQALALGGDIFIHGGCATIGCVPIEDGNIQELYWLAVQATDRGQRIIPVHIFPTRLEPDRIRWLADVFDPEPDLLEFWQNLQAGYRYFEETRRVPWVTVAENGRYAVPQPPETAETTSPVLAAPDEPAPAGADSTAAARGSGGDPRP